jgi:hypothetical protein
MYIGVNNFDATAAAFTISVASASQSEGAGGAPKVITLPYSGMVGSVGDSFYSYTSAAATISITATALTDDVDVEVYTDASFATLDNFNWSCSLNIGVSVENCTASTPVPAGTPIFVKIVNMITPGATGATFILRTP